MKNEIFINFDNVQRGCNIPKWFILHFKKKTGKVLKYSGDYVAKKKYNNSKDIINSYGKKQQIKMWYKIALVINGKF